MLYYDFHQIQTPAMKTQSATKTAVEVTSLGKYVGTGTILCPFAFNRK